MKAAHITQTGSPDVIQFGELPTPEPAPHQVLIRVAAVAVNPIDTYIRSGLVPAPLPLPFIIGSDLAGTVAAVGDQAPRFKVGDRVWASNQGLLGRQGTFAEFAAVDEGWVHPLPAGVSFAAGAANALVGITAHLGLLRVGHLRPAETMFINGGAGGVGSTVIQVAKALGARVITTAGSEANAAACRALGADVVLNYRTQDIPAALQQHAPKGVDLWWETLREPDFIRIVTALAPRGRAIVMAGRDARPPFPVGPFYVKCCSLHGFVMFNYTAAEQQDCATDLNRWLASGALKPRIGRVFPLREAAAAHRLQEENTLRQAGTLSGKIVLEV
jgi:NADPH2:quinone reductase